MTAENEAGAEVNTECEHPKEKRFMRGWTEVCGVCGQGRDIG